MRLIDADWLLDVVENIIKWDTERDRNRIVHQVRELTPTIEPNPNTGQWVNEGIYGEEHSMCSIRCSKCDWHYIGYLGDYNFCPNCGVRMN